MWGCGDVGMSAEVVHQAGVEPATSAFGGQRSIQLSYWCPKFLRKTSQTRKSSTSGQERQLSLE